MEQLAQIRGGAFSDVGAVFQILPSLFQLSGEPLDSGPAFFVAGTVFAARGAAEEIAASRPFRLRSRETLSHFRSPEGGKTQNMQEKQPDSEMGCFLVRRKGLEPPTCWFAEHPRPFAVRDRSSRSGRNSGFSARIPIHLRSGLHCFPGVSSGGGRRIRRGPRPSHRTSAGPCP